MPEYTDLQPTAIQPDAIRTPGEPVQLTNPLRFRYFCTCTTPHATYIYFDQMPPDRCPGNRPMYKDEKWVDPNTSPQQPVERHGHRTNYNWDGYKNVKQLEEPA